MKNLLILHLESITRQSLSMFASSFPNIRRAMQGGRVYGNFFSSATSTLMAITYLFHGNDFEFDASAVFEDIGPAGNTRHLFSVLADRGYSANFICLNGFHASGETRLASWPDDLPPVWASNEFPALFARFDELTDATPFAIYAWDLITHVEHSLTLAPFAEGLTDQVQRACAVADHAVGEMMAILERKGLLGNTTVVIFGDHGDDFWTHGFKGGMIHATEPYTQITWTPLALLDPALAPGPDPKLASTIDLAPTVLALLGIDAPEPFPHRGLNLLTQGQDIVFSQNFTASQPDNHELGVTKAFAAVDETYALLVSSRGLEMYAYRLDPGNHCNLLQLFDILPDGSLALQKRPGAAAHYRAALANNERAVEHVSRRFRALRDALAARIAAKRAYIVQRGAEPVTALDPRCLERVAAVSATPAPRPAAGQPVTSVSYSFEIR